jgi:Raf kinase inhibitor-like YbhB/YbcL family protein
MLDAVERLVRRAPSLASVLALALLALGCSSGGAGTNTGSVAPAASTSQPSAAGSGTPITSPEVSAMTTSNTSSTAKLALTSSAFEDGQPVPTKYSCRGSDVSPALAWHGVPADAGALVLLVDDPDGRDWVHWIVLDLPAQDGELPEAVDPSADPPQQGTNDFKKVGYGGPCPPSGTHHYRFTLYALAAPLGLAGHPGGADVRRALDGATVIDRVTLTGTFAA